MSKDLIQFPLKEDLYLDYHPSEQGFRVLKKVKTEQVKFYQKQLSDTGLIHSDQEYSTISMPFWDGLSLAQIQTIQSNLNTHSWVKLNLQLFIQWSLHLEKLHTQGYIHGDLNPSNLMMISPQSAFLIDYDHTHLESQANLGEGTPKYFSPQQFISGDLKTNDEIFSLGIILLESISGNHPFSGMSTEDLREDLQGDRTLLKNSLQKFKSGFPNQGLTELFEKVFIKEVIEDIDEFSESLEIALEEIDDVLGDELLLSKLEDLKLTCKIETLEKGLNYFVEKEHYDVAIHWCSELHVLCPHDDQYSQKLISIKLKLQGVESKVSFKNKWILGSAVVAIILTIMMTTLKPSDSRLNYHTAKLSKVSSETSNNAKIRVKDQHQIVRHPEARKRLISKRVIAPKGTQGPVILIDSVEIPLVENMFKITPGEYQVDFYKGSIYNRGVLRVDKKGFQWINLQ